MSRTLCIVGVGLVGGSAGLAARAAGWEVVGVDERHRATRTVLGLALSACANAPLEEVGYGVFRM